MDAHVWGTPSIALPEVCREVVDFKGQALVSGQPDECQIPGLNPAYSKAHMLLGGQHRG